MQQYGTEKMQRHQSLCPGRKGQKHSGLVEVANGHHDSRSDISNPGGGILQNKNKFKKGSNWRTFRRLHPGIVCWIPPWTMIHQSHRRNYGFRKGWWSWMKRTRMVDVARFFLDFTVAESCGKCVPAASA